MKYLWILACVLIACFIIPSAALAANDLINPNDDQTSNFVDVALATKAASIELAPRNIRVNCIWTNTIDTPMAYAEGCETELQVIGITTPLGRICKAEEAAALYHFLASDDCRYITGEDIYIDGGLKAGPSIQMIDHILKGLENK